MHQVLKASQFFALLIFLGGPLFWHGMWRPGAAASMSTAGSVLRKRVVFGTAAGAAVFVVSGIGDGLRAIAQLGFTHHWSDIMLFFTMTRFGRLTMLRGGLAIVAAVGLIYGMRRVEPALRRSVSRRALRRGLDVGAAVAAWLAVAAVLVTTSLLGHAAGKPGWWPVASDAVHLAASVVWVGGIFYLAALPWPMIRTGTAAHAQPLARLIGRFSLIAAVACGVVAGTGILSSWLHVPSAPALTGTEYGRVLVTKGVAFLAVMVIAACHRWMIVPQFERSAHRADAAVFREVTARFSVLVKAEVVLLAAVVAAASVLATTPPPH